jgi:hypothetical protein
MFVVIGDLHGNVKRLHRLDEVATPGMPFLQVGDLGWWPDTVKAFEAWGKQAQRKLYWIKGNHEHFPSLPLTAEAPVEVAPNIMFVPGGHVLELNGRRIGCLGGAASIDRAYRTAGFDWFPEEAILPHEEARAKTWTRLDLMLTHVPPQFVIERNFNRMLMVREFGVDYSWTDPNAVLVQKLWDSSGRPPLISGHVHRSIKDPANHIRVLDIDEALEIK